MAKPTTEQMLLLREELDKFRKALDREFNVRAHYTAFVSPTVNSPNRVLILVRAFLKARPTKKAVSNG